MSHWVINANVIHNAPEITHSVNPVPMTAVYVLAKMDFIATVAAVFRVSKKLIAIKKKRLLIVFEI